jgi:hypothetical protein
MVTDLKLLATAMNRITRAIACAGMTVAALLVLVGCGPISHPSPTDLELTLNSDKPSYKSGESFTGTLTFVNKTRRPIDVQFATLGQYHVDVYDSEGVARIEGFPGAGAPAVSHLTLDPLGMRVDTLKFLLVYYVDTIPHALPPGAYRLHAWIDRFEDIYSEENITIGDQSSGAPAEAASGRLPRRRYH